ncbi:MAG: hypothetical protein ACYDDF_07120 [Thermoplasmatota archaeon]
MALSFEDTWIKAAVEHRVLNVTYVNKETRLVYTKRDICPDYIEASPGGSTACWAIIAHAPQLGVKSFNAANFQLCKVTESRFNPPTNARWKDLVTIYKDRGLEGKTF